MTSGAALSAIDVQLVQEVIAGQERAFGRRRLLRELPGYAAPDGLVRAYQGSRLQALPHWRSALLKLIPCKNHDGLVCILVRMKDWKRLVAEIKTDRVLGELQHLAAETLVPRHSGRPYAFVVYAGDVPSNVRPNTAVAFFCSERLDQANVILEDIRSAAYREYLQVLEFEPLIQTNNGFAYALLRNAWGDVGHGTLRESEESVVRRLSKQLAAAVERARETSCLALSRSQEATVQIIGVASIATARLRRSTVKQYKAFLELESDLKRLADICTSISKIALFLASVLGSIASALYFIWQHFFGK